MKKKTPKNRRDIDRAKQTRKRQIKQLDKNIEEDIELLKDLSFILTSENNDISIGDFYKINNTSAHGVFIVEEIYPTYAKLRNIVTGYSIGEQLFELNKQKKIPEQEAKKFVNGYFKEFVLNDLLKRKEKNKKIETRKGLNNNETF